MSTATTTGQPRMKNPALVIGEAMPAIRALYASTQKGGVPSDTLDHAPAGRVEELRMTSLASGAARPTATDRTGETTR